MYQLEFIYDCRGSRFSFLSHYVFRTRADAESNAMELWAVVASKGDEFIKYEVHWLSYYGE